MTYEEAMNVEEAIEVIKTSRFGGTRAGGKTLFSVAIKIVIQAAEKQIPKKPVVIGGFTVCPRCYEEYGFSYDILVGMKGLKTGKCYCLNCGQAIGSSDWSDEEWRNI